MSAAETISARPRIVTIVGWVWLVLAGVRCLESLVGLIVWKVGGVDRLTLLRFQTERMPVRIAGVETFMNSAIPIMVAQVVAAGVVAWIAFELLRLKRWARPALQAAAGLGILITLGAAILVYTVTARLTGLEPTEAEQVRVAGIAAAAFITLLGSTFFGLTIWILSRPAVRRAFEPERSSPAS